MSGKGKISCWHAFNNAESFVPEAFGKLVMSHLRTARKMPLNGMYACFIGQAQQLTILLS